MAGILKEIRVIEEIIGGKVPLRRVGI